MNQKNRILLLIILPALLLLVGAYLFIGPATTFDEKQRYLYIRTGSNNKTTVIQTLKDSSFIRNIALFELLADQMKIWPRLKPGKYKISKGTSLLQLARTLRNNRQETVNLVITKIRTRQQFAGLVGRKFECDSATFLQYISSNDSLKQWGVDTTTLISIVLPDTYEHYWSVQPQQILKKLQKQFVKFWNEERAQKAAMLGFSPLQVSVIASIVEEETIRHDEKALIASVYINRLKKGMNLGADPTVKFAVGDFSIKRILFKHITSTAASPYNTYKNKGLPPGPICTPSPITLDAVLNAEPTNYLFFCAKPNGNGYHAFAETDKEHLLNAKAYQQWLDENLVR